jgi:hypothetical protein
MTNVDDVIAAAQKLNKEKDESALILLIGMREKEIVRNPALKDDPNLSPEYGPHMGGLDDLKLLGRKIVSRWNKDLHNIVCGSGQAGAEIRKSILESLKLDETAMIGAVAMALITMAVPGAIAAPAAAFVVKVFILPAKDELCSAWGEAIAAAG